jgi:O-antigen/teichoic acid export membrane protein
MFVYVSRIITGAIIARTLGPAAMGLWIILLMIPSYAEAFGRLKFDISAVYFLGKGKYKLGEVTYLLNIAAFLSSFVLMLICALNFNFLNTYLFKGGLPVNYLFFMVLLSIPIRFLGISYSYLLIHLEDIKAYNFFVLCQQFFSQVLAIIFLLVFRWGLASMVYATLIAGLVALVYSAWRIQKTEKMIPNFNLEMIKDFFGFSYNLYLSGLVSQLNTYVGGLLVAFFMLPAQVAFFRMGQDKALLLRKIPSAINTILYPRISKGVKHSADLTIISYRISLILMSFAAIIGVFLIRPVAFVLYGKDFLPLTVSFWILIPGMVLAGASSVFNQYFIGIGRPRITLYISFIPLVCQIIMGFILIPIFGVIGAAFTASLMLVTVSIITIVVFHKITKISLLQIILPNATDFRLIYGFIKERFLSLKSKVKVRRKRAEVGIK